MRSAPGRFARWREHERLLGIAVATLLVMSGQGMVSPVLPLFAADFGVSTATVGLTLSVFALARLVLNVPLGAWADRRGRRPLLVGGPIVSALGMAGSGLADGIGSLLVWRAIAGAGSAMYMTGAQIYLIDISSPINRSRVLGANQAALLAGVSIGPGLGGLLAHAFGFRAPFGVVAIAGAAAALWAWWRLPETLAQRGAPAHEAPEASSDRGALLRSRNFLLVCTVTAAVFFTRAGGRFTVLALLAASAFGYSVGGLGALFTAMALINLAGVGPASALADRFGRKWAIVPSGLMVALTLAAIAWTHDPSFFLVASLALAVGTALLGPAPAAYAADIAPERSRGLAMGIFRSAGDLGFVTGPFLLGGLADLSSLRTALAANAVLIALSALAFAWGAHEARRRPDA